MREAKEGDLVRVIYEGELENGETFETSADAGPLEFVIGDGTVMPAFEKGLIGMKAGENKTIKVNPEEGYGMRNEELIQEVPRSNLGNEIDPSPGMVLGMNIERDGKTHQVPAMVVEVQQDTVRLDYNHPLAGQELFYKVTVESISDQPTEDSSIH